MRQGENKEARQHKEGNAILMRARAEWKTEKKKLEGELEQLRAKNALLEQRMNRMHQDPKTGNIQTTEVTTDAEVQTDLELDWSERME